MNFTDIGIRKDFIQALTEMNIVEPSEIQQKMIPLLLNGESDVIGQAQTGTGKTAAFGLPMLHQIDSQNKVIQGLILCPTRELGKQVAKQLFRYTKYSEQVYVEAVYGGEHIDRQISALARPTHIVVATPGRLIDLVKKKALDLSHVKTVILDEADEMLSMGFKKELDEILSFLPQVENKWLFSATIPAGIREIIAQHMSKDATHIKINPDNVVNKKIDHRYVVCEEDAKLFILQEFLKHQHKNRGVIFCKTKAATKKLAKQLIAKNILADAIHGDLLQKERDKVMRAFKGKKIQILVSTDVAARGIDVEGLTYVVHYQLPESDEYYLHRSGRTARAGKDGISLALINTKEVKTIRNYERTLGIGFKQLR